MRTFQGIGPHSSHAYQGGCSVTSISKAQKKKILSNPVAIFSDSCPEATDQHVSALNELWLEYTEQKKQHKEVQNQGRIISRKIGEAKRAGIPLDELMADMREHGNNLAAISKQLTDTGNRILAFFEPADHSEYSEIQSSHSPDGRIYPASEHLRNEVRISLLMNEQEDWDNYVAKNPAASIYHQSRWKDLIHKTFGHECFYFLARSNAGNIVGILPLIRLKSILFGDFLVSMPYFNYGGAIADHPSIEKKLMQTANAHAAQLGVSHIEYRDDIPRNEFPARSDKVNMILPLPDSHNELWEAFTSKLRAQIRRPQRERPEILSGGKEYLNEFYVVFARNMRDLGTPVYGKSFFGNILRGFPEESRIVIVRMGDRPVSAAFLLGYRGLLEIPWASTIRDVNHLSINMLLYWEVLKIAIDKKYRLFDFGRSSCDSGTFQFKRQWGAIPRQLYWHYWLPQDKKIPSLNPDNPKFKMAINTWKRLPLSITNFLGPLIVRNLP